uniref:Uncharacterized protein n=1 Tax=Phytophthora ramorum TaxID=164328 RepID=H3H6E2_PHYRM
MAGGSLFQVGEDVEFWRVLIHLGILAFCLVLFEKALHRLEHKFPPSQKYQHMLKKVYRELMVLGLISLGLKILKENPDIDSYSKTIIAFQVADLTIFLLALALILQSTAVFLLLRNQNDRAERAELITTQDLANSVNAAKKAEEAGPSFFQTLCCCGRAAKRRANEKQLIELRLIRRLFLRRFGLPQLFPFSKYLSRAQANQISHMIEVEPSMWVALLLVAWTICGLLEVLKTLDTDLPESHELVEAFMMMAWVLLLLHIMVFFYFRSCMHELLHAAAYSDNKTTLVSNLSAIADEEAHAWQNEEADKALEVMSSIQEHHEELEYRRIQSQRKRNSTFQRVVNYFKDEKEVARDSLSGVVAGSPSLEFRSFSQKGWHIGVMLLLILNGFLITLFVQCAVYDLDDIYEDFGTLPAVMVPLPLVVNAVFLQRHIFYDFVIVSNILRIDSHTLCDVVENFSEVYERCPPKDEEEIEEETCPNGRTFVMDGLQFLASKPADLGVQTEQEHPYDLFIVDVYTGWNPFAFFVREEMMHVRDNWLTADGVLVMNFVGYMQDPRAVAPKSIYRTLQSVFKHVKCFREMEEEDEPDAANIVFYASDKPFSFNLPTTREYRNPPVHTFFSVVKNFPKWEV